VFSGDGGENAPAYVETRSQPDETRLRRRGKIIENAVGDGFMVSALVAVAQI
jgi:hypothetical protein